MADTQTVLTLTMTAAKEAFLSSMLDDASPAQAAEAAFDALAASLKAIFGEAPAQFAELKAAAMAQFGQALNGGLSAESAFNNALAQLSTTLANSDFGGLAPGVDLGGAAGVVTLDDVLVLSRDIDGMLNLDDLGMDGVFGSPEESYLNLLEDNPLLSGGQGGGPLAGPMPTDRTVGDDPTDYMLQMFPGGGPGPGPGPNDPTDFAVRANAASVTEGDSGITLYQFTVTRSGNIDGTNQIDWSVAGSGADPADNADFAGLLLPSGVLTFAPGETVKTISVELAGDPAVEPDETFTVTIANATGPDARIITPTAQGTIINDDQEPVVGDGAQFSIALDSPARQSESDDGETVVFTFTVTRSGDTSVAHTVDWTVAGNGDHPAGPDDFGGSLPYGTLSFAAGETSKTINVTVSGDTDIEDHETFAVTLSNPSVGAAIGVAAAAAVIVNDDSPPYTGPCFPCVAQTVTIANATSSIVMAGNPQCDIMNLNLVNTTALTGYNISMDGSGCGDTLRANLEGSGLVSGNQLNVFGATSSDTINVALRASALNTPTTAIGPFAQHVIQANTLNIDAGACNDTVTVLLNAETLRSVTGTATAGAFFAMGGAVANGIAINGGTGNDTIGLSVLADAGAHARASVTASSPTSSSSFVSAQAMAFIAGGIVSSNHVLMSGGDGNDQMSALIQAAVEQSAFANGPQANAGAFMALGFIGTFSPTGSASGNQITMIGGNGADTISLTLSASAAMTVQASASSSSAQAFGNAALGGILQNNISVSGGNDADSLTVLLHAEKQISAVANGYTAMAGAGNNTGSGPFYTPSGFIGGVLFNDIDMYGGLGNDRLALTLSDAATYLARAEGSPAAFANANRAMGLVGMNQIAMSGGDGNDITMAVSLQAQAMASAVATASYFAVVGSAMPSLPGGNALGDSMAGALALGDSMAGALAIGPGPMSAAGAIAGVFANAIDMNGGQGNDRLSLRLAAAATNLARASASSGSANAAACLADAAVVSNGITMTGGSGTDTLTVLMHAVARASVEATASYSADAGSPVFPFPPFPTGVGFGGGLAGALALAPVSLSGAGAVAEVYSNIIQMHGAQGDDQLLLDLFASAANMARASANWGVADAAALLAGATVAGNGISMTGGAGTDSLTAMLRAQAQASAVADGGSSASALVSKAFAAVNSNQIFMDGGTGGDTLSLALAANAFANASAGASSSFAAATVAAQAFVNGNNVVMSGGAGGDDLSLMMMVLAGASATASAASSAWGSAHVRAAISNNNISMIGGDGDDELSLNLTASANDWAYVTASTTGFSIAASASIRGNTIRMSGGSGSDTLNLVVNNPSGSFSHNAINMSGGNGNDGFNIHLSNLGAASNNAVLVWGGAGSDTISIDAATSAAQFIFQYSAISELGDQINGLTSGHDVGFAFNHLNFAGTATAIPGVLTAGCFVNGSTAADANDHWIYDPIAQALYYDANGNVTTGDKQLVAQFDADLGLTAADITLT